MKKMIITLSIALVFSVWFKFTDSDEDSVRQQELIASVDSSAAVSSAPINIVGHAPIPASEMSESQSQSPSSTQAQTQTKPYDGWDDRLPEDYKNWWRSRGRFKEFDLQEHRRLSLDELESLANKGDLKAIEVLIQNALEAKNSARYDELVNLAVTSGSVSAITLLTASKLGDYISFDRKKTEDILEAFAYEAFAFRRGDLTANYRKFAGNYNFYPNQEQERYIEQRADELMIEYEEKRKALGFPPFDNTPLASEKEYYDGAKEYRERKELEYRAREKDYRLQQEAEGKE
jgi:hypothetical protein